MDGFFGDLNTQVFTKFTKCSMDGKYFLLRIFIRVINAMKITNIKNNLMNDVIIIRYM